MPCQWWADSELVYRCASSFQKNTGLRVGLRSERTSGVDTSHTTKRGAAETSTGRCLVRGDANMQSRRRLLPLHFRVCGKM